MFWFSWLCSILMLVFAFYSPAVVGKICEWMTKVSGPIQGMLNVLVALIAVLSIYEAYKKFEIKGARGEALSGFETVKKALPYLRDLSKSSLLTTLIFIISEIEDTVLLKRAKSYEFYLEIKKIFRQHLISNEEAILSLNDFCLNNNLSFGGSADILVLTVFIKLIEDQF